MGLQVSRIPELVQNEILNYLSITDAVALIGVGGDAATAVKHNRQFWQKKAKQLHFLDPVTFRSLDSAPALRIHEIRRMVLDADRMLKRARLRLDARQDAETRKDVGSEITFIAVDEKLGNVAVQLFNNTTQIYSLERFDDPPTILQNPHTITEIALHSELLFFRPPVDRKHHHTDVVRWPIRDNHPQIPQPRTAHLGPSFGDIEILRPFAPLPGDGHIRFYPDEKLVNPVYRMRKSTNMLLVHDPIGNSLLTYLLASEWFNPSAIKYRLSVDEKLHDHAARENLVILVIEIGGQFFYRSYDPIAHEVRRQFRFGSNIANTRPHIVFPFIFMYRTDPELLLPPAEMMNLPCGYQPGRILTKAFRINAQRPPVELRVSVGPSPPRFIPTTRSFFPFFGEPQQWHVEILLADELTRSPGTDDMDPFFDFTDSPVFASLGLSILYARNNATLVLKRYALS